MSTFTQLTLISSQVEGLASLVFVTSETALQRTRNDVVCGALLVLPCPKRQF